MGDMKNFLPLPEVRGLPAAWRPAASAPGRRGPASAAGWSAEAEGAASAAAAFAAPPPPPPKTSSALRRRQRPLQSESEEVFEAPSENTVSEDRRA